MKPSVSHWLFTALLLSSGAATASNESPPPLETTVAYRVSIDATGKLVSATPLPSDLAPEIVRAALGLAKELKFEPARAQGQPAASETMLSMTVQFVPAPDGSYRPALKSASLMPQKLTMPVPSWPKLRHSSRRPSVLVLLALQVRPDGKINAKQTKLLHSGIEEGDAEDLDRMVESAIKSTARFTFQPDVVAGQPISTVIKMPIRYCDGSQVCSRPVEPAPTEETLGLPRSATEGVSLPVLLKNPPAG